MIEEFSFTPAEVCVSNLGDIGLEQFRLGDLRRLELADIADCAVEFILSLGDTLSVGDDLVALSSALSGTVPNAPEHLCAVARSISNIDRVMLSDLLVLSMSAHGITVQLGDLLAAGGAVSRFVYVRNSFSDEAFDVLSQDVADPRVRYVSGFSECVTQLIAGSADVCLLPLEERGGARLSTVMELIYRNDLKINSVTPVFGYDGNADLKYAMVSKAFVLPECAEGDDRYLELRLEAQSEVPLGEVLSAAEYLSMSVYRVNTVSFDTEGSQDSWFSVVIREGEGKLIPFLVYLALFVPGHTTVGVYKNLE